MVIVERKKKVSGQEKIYTELNKKGMIIFFLTTNIEIRANK